MYSVRIHGRGGQGVVTAAELLSRAAFAQGKHAQAFPSFGSERNGAPVMAYCRVDTRPIRLREPIIKPDAVVIQDGTLLQALDCLQGLREGGLVVVNSQRTAEQLGIATARGIRCVVLPATDMARHFLGRPVPNAALMGALAAADGMLSLDAIEEVLRERFGGRVGEGNAKAAAAGYRMVTSGKAWRADVEAA